jgi:hypothetical protein
VRQPGVLVSEQRCLAAMVSAEGNACHEAPTTKPLKVTMPLGGIHPAGAEAAMDGWAGQTDLTCTNLRI